MIAVLGGLGAALAWALATLAAARASRVLGPWSTTALVVSVGFVATMPLLALEPPPATIASGDIAWLLLAGLGYAVGMVFNYAALTGGKVPVTAPIVSTEGSIAAVLAVLGGEAASPLMGAMLLLIAAGVFVVALKPGGAADVLSGSGARYVGFAMAAAMIFGVGLYASGRASANVPASWVVAAGRIAGVAEVVGIYLYAWGARESIAVTAVLSSQFAVMAALMAHRLGERISPRQWLGVAGVTTGVVVITLTRL